MSVNYRRLISYIYAYEGGVKGRNVGFAKLETRNGQCRIQVSVRRIYVGSQDTGVYLLAGSSELLIGRIFLRNGAGEFRTTVPVNRVAGSDYSIDQCYGLTIHSLDDSWQCYTTIWEDAVAHAAEVELSEAVSELLEEKAMQQVPDSSVSELSIAVGQESVSEQIAAELEAQLAQEAAQAAREMAQEKWPDSRDHVQMNQGQGLPGAAKAVGAMSQEMSVRAAESAGMVPEKPGEAEPVSMMWERAEAEVAQPAGMMPEKPEPDMVENIPGVPEEAENGVGGNVPIEPGAVGQNISDALASVSGGVQRDDRAPMQPTPASTASPAVDESQPGDSQRQNVESWEWEQERRKHLDVLDAQEPEEDVEAAKLWNYFVRTYPKIQAFDYKDGCEILTIKPQDIGLLPREMWTYGNNSFLLHGYYNHRYLILVRLNNQNSGPRFLLGVPGHYYSNEKYMAAMFGFPNFVLSKMQPSGDGRFGYWYTDIRLGNQ